MKYLSEKGFSHLEILLIVVVLALVGGAGFYVLSHDKKTENPQATTTTTAKKGSEAEPKLESKPEPLSVRQNWYRYSSEDKIFSIQLPNGTEFISAEETVFLFTRQSIPLNSTSAATVINVEGGSDNPIGLFVSYRDKESIIKRGEKKEPLKSYAGDNIEHYEFNQSVEPDGIDIPKGASSNLFVLEKSNKMVTVMYNTTSDVNLEYVQEMVKTIELK